MKQNLVLGIVYGLMVFYLKETLNQCVKFLLTSEIKEFITNH